jgi:hypothetical protein
MQVLWKRIQGKKTSMGLDHYYYNSDNCSHEWSIFRLIVDKNIFVDTPNQLCGKNKF